MKFCCSSSVSPCPTHPGLSSFGTVSPRNLAVSMGHLSDSVLLGSLFILALYVFRYVLYPERSWARVDLVVLGCKTSSLLMAGGLVRRTLLSAILAIDSLTDSVCMCFNLALFSFSDRSRAEIELICSPNSETNVFFILRKFREGEGDKFTFIWMVRSLGCKKKLLAEHLTVIFYRHDLSFCM